MRSLSDYRGRPIVQESPPARLAVPTLVRGSNVECRLLVMKPRPMKSLSRRTSKTRTRREFMAAATTSAGGSCPPLSSHRLHGPKASGPQAPSRTGPVPRQGDGGLRADGAAQDAWTFERRALGPKDVAIKIDHFGAICHSDIHTIHGDWGPVTYPQIVGHEITGTVAEESDRAPSKFQPSAPASASGRW